MCKLSQAENIKKECLSHVIVNIHTFQQLLGKLSRNIMASKKAFSQNCEDSNFDYPDWLQKKPVEG